jgi:hypothetical protein
VARYAKSRQRVAADKAEADAFTALAIEFFPQLQEQARRAPAPLA